MSVLEELKKRKPKSRFMSLADSAAVSFVNEMVSTQCVPLDLILGGGIPVGRMTEIYGDTSTGKTLLALHILAETQAMGGIAALLDTETAVARDVAEFVGVNNEELIYSTPDVVEDVYDDIVQLMDLKDELYPERIMTIVWDSVAATSSEAEIAKVREKGLSTGYPPTAREISQMMRVMKLMVARRNIALVLLNQTRQKIGVMFGSDVATFGGKAIGFYSSIRLMLKQVGKIKKKGKIVGINTRAYISKSKIAPPFRQCDIPILFDVGIDKPGSILIWLKKEKLVITRGGWNYITIGGEELQFRSDGFNDVYEKYENEVIDFMWGTDEDEDEEE